MEPIHKLILVIVVLFSIAVLYAAFYSKDLRKFNPFLDKNLLQKGMDKPAIWLFYD